jgi:hypothetical protein
MVGGHDLTRYMGVPRLPVEMRIFAIPNESGITFEEIHAAISTMINAWLSDAASMPDPMKGLIALRNFLHTDESRFRDADNPSRPIPRDQVGVLNRTLGLALFTEAGLFEACGGHDAREVLGELIRRDLLFRNEGDRLQSKHALDGRRLRFYAVKLEILECDFQSFDGSVEPDLGQTGPAGSRDPD